jgi:hypothetical protein
MNKELIQRLQEQAMRVVGYIDGGYTELKSLDPEKFAELIVRECAEFVDYRLTNPDGASMAWCNGSDIKEHFGVE